MKTERTNIKYPIINNIPVDNNLPGLPAMLDQVQFISNVNSQLKDRGKITECMPYYIKYKADTNCIIAYRINYLVKGDSDPIEISCYAKLYTDNDYENALSKAESHRWIENNYPEILSLPELNSIIYFFPNDCIIDGLRLLSNPKKIQRILYEHYDKYPEKSWRISDRRLKLAPVRYKPERRAVFKCNSKAVNRESSEKKLIEFYLRIYADNTGEKIYTIQDMLYRRNISTKLSLPKPIAYLKDRKALLMESSPGTPLFGSLDKPNIESALRKAAIALAELHEIEDIDLHAKSEDEFSLEIGQSADLLRTLMPEFKSEIDNIENYLKDKIPQIEPDTLSFVHGDFHFGQVLLDDNGYSIIDFDRSFFGDCMVDIGNFIAHIKLAKFRRLISNDEKYINLLLKSYNSESNKPINTKAIKDWTILGLFMLGVSPFRNLDKNWKYISEGVINECISIMKK